MPFSDMVIPSMPRQGGGGVGDRFQLDWLVTDSWNLRYFLEQEWHAQTRDLQNSGLVSSCLAKHPGIIHDEQKKAVSPTVQ